MDRPKHSVIMDVRPGEELQFASLGVRVQMIHKSGRAARLRITTPNDVKVEKETVQSLAPSMAT